MTDHDQRSRPTLEDLLHLKRAERPTPEFWAKFEQELRQKQLTALVQKRRWWHDLSVLLNRRVYLPAGATAIVAFTLVTVRYATPTQVAVVENRAPQSAKSEPAVEMLEPVVVAAAESNQKAVREQPVAVSVIQDAAAPIELRPLMVAHRSDESSPSARSIAANIARLEQSEPELLNAVMGSRLSAPARVQTAAVAQDEGAASSSRKYRLIARYADRSLSPEPTPPASVRERLVRRLGEDLGDDISRIGVVGSRVSLKF